MEIVRKPHGKVVKFSAVQQGETFEHDGLVYQRVKVPGSDGMHAAELSAGLVIGFSVNDDVLLAPGKFVEK